MSLYNALHGTDSDADKLLAILRSQMPGFTPPRFRDCYFNGTHIVVHTRTGGGNRDEYESANDAMAAHPWYSHDADDDFDCTYADFYFTPPAEIAATLTKADSTPAEKWQALFSALNKGANTPATARALAVGGAVLGAVQEATTGDGPAVIIVDGTKAAQPAAGEEPKRD